MTQESRICFKSSVRSSVATRTADTTIPHFSELDPGQLPGLNCPGLFVTIKHDLQVTLVRYVTPIKCVVNPTTNHYIQLNSDCSNTSLSHVYIFSYSRLTRNMVNI
ncbi:hypothetical protein N7501_000954 [Penicillium viridicatum]|nr:hypothetical protein N7501_000954 [Penicillium viridicatum]